MSWFFIALLAIGESDNVSILPLLPPVEKMTGTTLPNGVDASRHAEALRAAPDHAKSFWVRRVAGDANATNVVFLIPQFHRNATTPIAWTTLGAEIAEVQIHIDTLVRRLVTSHRLSCIGTEGSSREKISRSSDLAKLASWHQELSRSQEATLAGLDPDAPRVRESVEAIVKILNASISQYAVYVDGVGAAQSRLAGKTLMRFGVEDAAANEEGVTLLEELKAIEEELAKLEPKTQSEGAGVVGQMWLSEYPAYERNTLSPFADAVAQLEALRLELRGEGLSAPVESLNAFIGRVRRISKTLLQPEEVAATIAYYRELEKRTVTGRKLTKAEERRRKRLLAKLDRVSARYAEVTRTRRERVAANKVIDKMGTSCALVMGAGHEKGLVKELVAAAKKRGTSLGIVVVAPFSFGD